MGGESRERSTARPSMAFPDALPDRSAQTKVLKARPESAQGCDVVSPALPSQVAGEIEAAFANAGYTRVSEARHHSTGPGGRS